MSTNRALTTLANLKQLIASQRGQNTDDALIAAMVQRMSQAMLSAMNRQSVYLTQYTEYRDGRGGNRLMLREWPVQTVQSLSIWGQTVSQVTLPPAAGAPYGPGFFVQPPDPFPPGRLCELTLYGRYFNAPPNGVQVVYTAGYGVIGEANTVPVSGSYTLRTQNPYGSWMADSGVSYAGGAALVNVPSAPAVGQYSVDLNPADDTFGTYTFNAADAGKAVSVTYSYVPSDLEQACAEWVMERYAYKNRPSEKAKSQGGALTASFSIDAVPTFVRAAMQPYMRVAPVAD